MAPRPPRLRRYGIAHPAYPLEEEIDMSFFSSSKKIVWQFVSIFEYFSFYVV
jgi:hypothetical protein